MNELMRTAIISIVAVFTYVTTQVYLADLGGPANKVLVVSACVFGVGIFIGAGVVNFMIAKFSRPPAPKFPPTKPLSAVLVVAALSLLAVTSASASTPQYTFTDSINTTLNNTGNQSIGIFVFTKQAHTPATLNFSSFTTTPAQQFDKFIWANINYTIDITDPNGIHTILVPNSQYFVPLTGNYVYSALSDASLTGIIVVQAATPLQVNVTGAAGPFPVRFTPSSFSLTGTEQIVNVTIDVPSNFPPNTVTFNATFDTNAEDRTYNKTLTLPEIRRWSVVQNTMPNNYSIKGGDTQDIGVITVRNDGNTNFDIESQITGNGQSYVSTQSKVTLFKDTNSQFDIRARIPAQQQDGNYTASIRLFGYNQEYVTGINLTVKDLIPPTIANVTFSDEFLQHDVRIKVFPQDNIEVNKTVITINGASNPMVKDNNAFYYDTKFTSPTAYAFTVCATDNGGNSACTNFTKTFQLLDIINGSRAIDLLSKKYNSYASKKLFNLREKPPSGLTIRLENFQSSTDTANASKPLIAQDGGFYSVRVVDGDGSFKYFSGLNDTVQVFSAGDIKLEVRADKDALDNATRSTYTGVVSIANQPWRTVYDPVSFNGITIDYSLPDPFKIEWGTGGGFLDCDVRDTGDLETSRGVCNLEMPAEDLSKDLVVPISLKEKQYLEDQVNQTTVNYEKKLKNREILSGVLLGLLTILSIYSFYRVVVQPKLLVIKK